MSATVEELLPGDEVTIGSMSAVVIAVTRHHRYEGLSLVLWRLDDGSLSPDALSPRQDVGEVTPSTWTERNERLIAAVTR